MSLTSFLKIPDVIEKLKPLRPKVPRKINVPLKVEPRSKRYDMVGTAFDYLLRFELQRRAPYAVAEKWIAEYVPAKLWKETAKFAGGFDLLSGVIDTENYMPPEEVGKRARVILENAKVAVSTYLKTKNPNGAQLFELAAHAIRLAKLDVVFRAFRLDPRFYIANPEDVEDLIAMLGIVPFDSLIHSMVILLNPNFKESSQLVGSADTDLITGDLLVDFKASKKGEIDVKYLDQLLGYYLLCRNQRRLDPKFPEINRVSLYFCRYGYLWILDVKTWTDNPEFPEIEKWFFKRAKDVFGV